MRKTASRRRSGAEGFSMLELLITITVGVILTGIAIPKVVSLARGFRSLGDARSLSDTVSLAKMRAAAEFTEARVYADTTNRLYRIELWDRTRNCWITDGDVSGQCSSAYSSPNTPPSVLLSTSVSFGFGSLSSPPNNTQSTLAQAPACQSDTDTQNQNAGSLANSACVVFNSRGIPVDNNLAATTNDALYVTDSNSAYGVTVLATGLIQTWRTDLTSGTWSNR